MDQTLDNKEQGLKTIVMGWLRLAERREVS